MNTSVEYCILKTVWDEHDPYDDCCYVNGIDIDRTSESILDCIRNEGDSDSPPHSVESTTYSCKRIKVNPLLKKPGSFYVNPLLKR